MTKPFAISAFRQTPPQRGGLELMPRAPRAGRYHDEGDPSPLYGSSSPQAAMAELLRQAARGDLSFDSGDSRRMSNLGLPDGPFLDLTDPEVRDAEGVTLDDLVADDTTTTREVARRARLRGDVIGIRAPSAAMDGEVTFVVFAEHVSQVVLVSDEIVRIVDYVAGQEPPGPSAA